MFIASGLKREVTMHTIGKLNLAINVDNLAINVDSNGKSGLSISDNIENQNQFLNFPLSIVCVENGSETHCVEGISTRDNLTASQELFTAFDEMQSLILKMSDTPALPEPNGRPEFNKVATLCILNERSSEPVEAILPTLMTESLFSTNVSAVQNNPARIGEMQSLNKDYNYPLLSTPMQQPATLMSQAEQVNGEYKTHRLQASLISNLTLPNLNSKKSPVQLSEINSQQVANLVNLSSTSTASITQNSSVSTSETPKYSETQTFSHFLKIHETTWKPQFSNRILETLASGKQDLELLIVPKSLGKIAIHVSSSGDLLNLTISADNLKTASLLSAALPEIENNLKDSGIGVLSTKLGSNGAHAEQEQNNAKSDAEPSTSFHSQSAESEDDEGVQKIGAVGYHTGKYSYEV